MAFLFRKYCPFTSMPSTWSVFSSGCALRFVPFGGLATNPALSAGTMIMKMIRSTSITSIIGVTFGSALTPPPAVVDIAIVYLLHLITRWGRRGGRPRSAARRIAVLDYGTLSGTSVAESGRNCWYEYWYERSFPTPFLLRDRRVAGRRGRIELAREPRTSELAGDALDQVVDHLLGGVG